MSIWQTIEDVKNMDVPDRQADKTIAEIIGMAEKDANGKQYWVLGDRLFQRVPAFTSSIDAAMMAIEASGSVEDGGVTFGLTPATAVLNGGEHCHGANAAIALCIAALTRMARERR